MPSSLIQLYKKGSVGTRELYGNGRQDSSLVDIIAVHGLNENLLEAWTDPGTKNLWLQDFLPQDIQVGRILTFGYDASASSFFGSVCADKLQSHAHTLVANLQADRSLEGCDQRPIIFLCHGLGGILVKKALTYSWTRTSSHVEHLHSIYVSTYAILFFGTPHRDIDEDIWLELEEVNRTNHNHDMRPSEGAHTVKRNDSTTLSEINDQFINIEKDFRMYFFWEDMRTQFRGRSGLVVEQANAAPILNSERSGINATHASMVRFSTTNSSDYRMVKAALTRYCRDAPEKISFRWKRAHENLLRARADEAYELTLVYDMKNASQGYQRPLPSQRRLNKFFYPPKAIAADFVGREEATKALNKAFFAPEDDSKLRRQKIFIIHGIGGSGKTEFCAKFARDHQERFTGVFTVDASSTQTIKESFERIGKYGGLEATSSSGKYWLSTLEEPWLIIIDNADNSESNLLSCLSVGDRGNVVVTTRNPDFRRFATAGSIEFKGLRESEALHLLLRSADLPRPWDASTENLGKEIAKALGYLALGLVQAGTYIFRKVCGLKDYLQFHTQQRTRHRRVSRGAKALDPLEDKDRDKVYAAFDVSLNHLVTKDSIASQDAVELLKIVAFYHFEHIRVDIFTRGTENRLKMLDNPIDQSATTKIFQPILNRLCPPRPLPRFLKDHPAMLSPYRVRQALFELWSLSLISYDGKDATFSLNPSAHRWARERLDLGEEAIWAQVALNTLLEPVALPPDGQSEDHNQFRKDILPHLDACLEACTIHFNDYNSRMGRLQLSLTMILKPTLLSILRDKALSAGKCGYVYADRGRFKEAANYLSMVKDVLLHIVGHKDEKTMDAMLGLAATYWGLGRLDEAIDLQIKVVEARKQVFGHGHVKTLLAMDQLGRSHWLNGQYREALHLGQLTTDFMNLTLGPTDDRTLAAMDNLGVVLGSWHKFEESATIHRKVVTVRRKQLGPSNLETLTSINNLAMALSDLGQLEEAQELMMKVYEERRVQLGKEHPWTLWALCYLAKIKVKLGDLNEAEEMLDGGIDAGKRSLHEDHLGVLMGRGELARVYSRQGRLDEAVDLLSDTVRRIENSRGIEHPDSFYALWKLSQLYRRQGRVQEALGACETALRRAEKRLSNEHPMVEKIATELQGLKSARYESTTKKEDHGKETPEGRETSNMKRRIKPRTQMTL